MVFLLIMFMVLAPVVATGNDAWWQSATAAYALAAGLEPGITRISIQELDTAGQVKSREWAEIHSRRDGLQLVSTVVRAEKNGKDVTQDWQKRYARSGSGQGGQGGQGGPPAGFDATPFDPVWAPFVVRTGSRLVALGQEVGYSIQKGDTLIEGLATFTSDGRALTAWQRWIRLPPFVSSIASTLEYGSHDDALVVSTMQISAEASILFVKMRYRLTLEFSEWRSKPDGS